MPGLAAMASADMVSESLARRRLGVGIAPAGKRQYRLAIRAPNVAVANSAAVERFAQLAKGEIDVRVTGPVRKQALNLQAGNRPTVLGCSVGHRKVTAGTLGGFVKRRNGGKEVHILSNNHVLANENSAALGDMILQPGHLDGGRVRDRIATLVRFRRLLRSKANDVDCAIAEIDEEVDCNLRRLPGIGVLGGVRRAAVDEGLTVAKVGRTTGTTHGRVTAFEMDVEVEYDLGNLRFVNQIEIEGAGRRAFSDGGDSGSLIVDSDNRAMAQLFAGTDEGGSNGKGLTYATPIRTVLDTLQVDLLY